MPGEDYQGLADGELIARTVAGDRAAFGALAVRHQAAIHRLARHLTGSPAAAEDVLQETFLSALRAAPGFRGDASVKTWLLTIARHAALRLRRRARVQPVEDSSLEALGLEAGWGSEEDPERVLAVTQESARLGRALARLGEEAREILLLRDVEGLSGEDTAAALGIGLAAMKSRLHRARLRLLAEVRREGDDHGA